MRAVAAGGAKMSKRACWLGVVVAVAAVSAVAPAVAAERRYVPDTDDWFAARHAIEERHDAIALLEANPQTDDGYKAPIISRARRETARLQAMLQRPQWRYVTPCCYSRPPIRIR
jgi:hypothetical protein